MKTHPYLTNLSDAEWARLEPLLPAAHTGHPRQHHVRTIVNALLYVLRTGCAWRLLPPDWPAWQSVYYLLPAQMAPDGTLERIHTVLREELTGGSIPGETSSTQRAATPAKAESEPQRLWAAIPAVPVPTASRIRPATSWSGRPV